MAELAVFARAHPVDDEASSKKAQRSTSEIRQYRVVGHRKSHAERGCLKNNLIYAPVAEQADALDSGSSRGNSVQVRFLSGAPKNALLSIDKGAFLCLGVFTERGANFLKNADFVCNVRFDTKLSRRFFLYKHKK